MLCSNSLPDIRSGNWTLHIALNASKGERTYGSYHIQNVNAYISRLMDWLHRE